MPAIILYMMKLSVCLCTVYLCYYFVLQRLTFYQWNRWYLILCSFLSFFIPLIDISFLLQQNNLEDKEWVGVIPQITTVIETGAVPVPIVQEGIGKWEILLGFFIAGIVVTLGRLLLQFASYRRMLKTARLLADGSFRIYQVPDAVPPFSFGRCIFVNSLMHEEKDLAEIIKHEFVHVRQKHTADMIWSELLCILNWYNPFSWLIRQSIRQNLEFIADHHVLLSGTDRKQYQYLLVKVMGAPQFRIATSFNFSSLKKRMVMMNKIKSAKCSLLRFLLLLPLLSLLLLAFRNRVMSETKQAADPVNKVVETIARGENEGRETPTDTLPKVKNRNLPEPNEAFLKRNPGVKGLAWNKQSVFVHFKKGGYKKYRLDSKEAMAAFAKLYGALPEPPPPPPEPLQPPALHRDDKAGDFEKQFFSNNPTIVLLHWPDERSIQIYLEGEMVEKYNLDDAADLQRAVNKYGKLPAIQKKQQEKNQEWRNNLLNFLNKSIGRPTGDGC